MTDEAWQPLSVRSGRDGGQDRTALVEGLPYWLEPSARSWMWDAVEQGGMPLLRRAERLMRLQFNNPTNSIDAVFVLDGFWVAADDHGRLDLLDLLLHEAERQHRVLKDDYRRQENAKEVVFRAARLAMAFTESGSAWRVASEPRWGLVRRADPTAQEQVRSVTSTEDDAARRLASAWDACFRHNPNYDQAYRDAVLAVEAVAIQIVVPKASRATLGTVVSHIRDTVDQWSVGGLSTPQISSGTALLAMLQTLWHNQQRHAQSDGSIGDIGRSEAEVAVSLAVTLVQWFQAGLVTRSGGAAEA